MRLRIISLRKASASLQSPMASRPLLRLGEYTLTLLRCEGAGEAYRNLDADELFYPQDAAIVVQGEAGELVVEAGAMLCVPRGWKRYTTAEGVAYVLTVSRTDHALSRNGYHAPLPPDPVRHATPEQVLATCTPATPHRLISCDRLVFYAEQVAGMGKTRPAGQGVWLMPIHGTVGVRRGGVVTTLNPTEIAQIPAGGSWNLFGYASVVWAHVEPL